MDEREEQIERIRSMEARLDRAEAVLTELEQATEAYLAAQTLFRELERYYESPLWRQDLAADEAGALPPALRRGVLSQDAVYDLLERESAWRDSLRNCLDESRAEEDMPGRETV